MIIFSNFSSRRSAERAVKAANKLRSNDAATFDLQLKLKIIFVGLYVKD